MYYIYWFVVGSCIGSFVNALVWRLPRGMDVVHGRSICPHCGHRLAWVDLIPLLSWLLLKGKCRYCQKHVSLRYPMIEGMEACLALVCGCCFDSIFEAILVFACMTLLVAIAWIDQDSMCIPDELQMILLIMILLMGLFFSRISFYQRLLGSCVIAVPMIFMNRMKKDCFGGGDIKLMAICGFWLGMTHIVLAFLLATWLGGGRGLYLLCRRKVQRTSCMPFAPFLVTGILLALFYGDVLISCYVHLLGG